MRRPFPREPLKFVFAGLVVLVLLTFAIAPFARSLVEQWSRLDVESRSRLVYRSMEGPILRALADGDEARLTSNLGAVAQDERILAIGLCDARGALRGASAMMPQTFSCQQVARSEGESFSSIVNDGRRVLVGAFPISARDQRVYLVVLHDLSYVDARLGAGPDLRRGWPGRGGAGRRGAGDACW